MHAAETCAPRPPETVRRAGRPRTPAAKAAWRRVTKILEEDGCGPLGDRGIFVLCSRTSGPRLRGEWAVAFSAIRSLCSVIVIWPDGHFSLLRDVGGEIRHTTYPTYI